MSDLSSETMAPATSLALDTDSQTIPSDTGVRPEMAEPAPVPAKTENQPESAKIGDIIRDEMKKDAAEQAKAAKTDEPAKDEAKAEDDKAKAEEKPARARGENGKFAKAEAADGAEVETEAKADPAEKRDSTGKLVEYGNAPKSFTPEAKERWANVPRSVRRDIDTMTQDYERAIEHYRGSSERYEEVRALDDELRGAGGSLKDSLDRVFALERLVQENPLQALQQVLTQAGPRKADGSPLTLREVAQFVLSQSDADYQRTMTPARQAPQEDPRIAQLQGEIIQMRQQQTIATVLEPFKATHPRFMELQDDIALFLKSDKVNPNLAPAERLEIAYDLAARVNPTSERQEPLREQVPEERVVTSGADKSIKSAPGSVSSENASPKRGGSIRDVLEDELRKRRYA